MNADFVKLLNEFNPDLEIRENYSGRSMYGKTTHAIVCDCQSEILSTLADMFDRFDKDDEEFQICLEGLSQGWTVDSMGLQKVFY